MNRKDFGRLIAALRKEHFDPVAGKVWSQKVLAQKTNLSSKIIVNLERGVKVNLDETTLIQLADAFSLTPLERQEFFAAAKTGGVKNFFVEMNMENYKDSASYIHGLLG